MTTFYTGTTIENLNMILSDGILKTNPPNRVWEEYSDAYVYLLPSDNMKEYGEPFELCMEQSSFAVSKLNHTKRVVIEIEGINEEQLLKDPDGPVHSVRYPKDISINFIRNVYIETKDNSLKVKELVAVTHFVQREKLSCLDLEYFFYENNQDIGLLYERISIPNIELVPYEYLIDDDELTAYYMDLIEEVDRNVSVNSYTLSELIKKI